MLSENKNNLIIFDQFIVDENLPKYKKIKEFKDNSTNSFLMVSNDNLRSISKPIDNKISVFNKIIQFWIIRNILMFLYFMFCFDKIKLNKVKETFKLVKKSCEEIDANDNRLLGYRQAAIVAENSGQTALKESLNEKYNICYSELKLKDIGFNKYISEENIINFVKKCPKGLRLDYIKNFTRQIPESIIDKKNKCDNLFLFDNYVIMHYDPTSKSYKETQREIELKKDPILFGLIKGSRKLYFIDEWIDEICDLNLDQIAELIGKKSIENIK